MVTRTVSRLVAPATSGTCAVSGSDETDALSAMTIVSAPAADG